MPHHVYIPTYSSSLKHSVLLEAWVDKLLPSTVARANDKDLDANIFHLMEQGLYKQGRAALSMLKHLKKLNINANVSNKIELHCPVSDGTVCGNSSELGLAIAVLLGSGECRKINVIATGCLAKSDYDVDVLAVDKLSEKLTAVSEEKKTGKFAGKPTLFFIPKSYKQQDGVDADGNPQFAILPWTDLQDQINGLEQGDDYFRVIPVEFLSEVLSELQTPASLIEPIALSHRVLYASAGFVTLVVGLLIWKLFMEVPNPPVIIQSSVQPVVVVSNDDYKNLINALGLQLRQEIEKRAELEKKFDCLENPSRCSDKLYQLKKSAESGNVKDQFQLASKHFLGNGDTQQDYKEAFKWFEKAAKQGHVRAQYFLGSMYYQGIGVDKNEKKGLDFLHKAGDKGALAEAKYTLELIKNQDGHSGWQSTLWERLATNAH